MHLTPCPFLSPTPDSNIPTPMGFKVTEVQPTPNPNAVKFLLDRPISDNPISFLNPSEGQRHPLASKLFALNGVTSLLLLGDFITVNKSGNVNWSGLTKKVEEILESFQE